MSRSSGRIGCKSVNSTPQFVFGRVVWGDTLVIASFPNNFCLLRLQYPLSFRPESMSFREVAPLFIKKCKSMPLTLSISGGLFGEILNNTVR